MKISLVHLELNGAVLATQLHKFIQRVFRLNFKNEYFVWVFTIVKTMLQKESCGFIKLLLCKLEKSEVQLVQRIGFGLKEKST